MLKKTSKIILVALLGICLALTAIFGLTSFKDGGSASADGKTAEDIIDLSYGPKDNVGQPTADGASNAIKVHFKGVNMSDGSFLENLAGFNDKLVVGTDSVEKTVAQWMSDAGSSRAFRIAVYGAGMYIQCESESNVLKASDIKYLTFKEGFALYEGTAGTKGDWVFSKTATTKVEGTDFPADIKLYVNRDANVYQYATSELTVASQPTKAVYEIGDTFDPSGMTLTAVTETSGTKTIEVTSAMCTADLSEAGAKQVTVSYAGKTVTVDVTVNAPAKVLTGIAYKSGSVSIEQNGSVNEMTLTDLIVTASYEGGTTEDVTVTSDMISVDPAVLGTVRGKVIYTLGNVTESCDIDVTVTDRTSGYDANNTYVIPVDGYYAGEDGGDRVLNDGGISIWFTTNAGFGKENVFQGLGEKWYSDGGFEEVTADINNYVLLNGKTFNELKTEGVDLTRFVLGWYGNGVFCLRIHVGGGYSLDTLETVTILRGFRMYNTSAQALGAKTPCDYTFEVAVKPGTTDNKMLVRKTESISVVSAPTKTVYTVGDEFNSNGMTIKAVYTDGGSAILSVKDRMISYDFSEAGEKNVTVTYNGKTATQAVTVNEPVATITGIAVKEGVTLTLKQYSVIPVLSADAKIVVSYSDDTTEEVDLTLAMISGYTNETVGKGKATVTYKEHECDINYTVSAYDGKSYFSGINYGPVYGTEGTGYASLVGIDEVGLSASLKALWEADKAQSAVIGKPNSDFITINGKTFTQLLSEGKVTRMLMYGKNFGFHIDDAEFMATVKNGAEICLLPGFAWVTYTADAWGVKDKYSEYTPIENAVVTTPMYFCFKNGVIEKVVDDVTLNGTPKADYYKGDVIDVTGLTLSVKYKGFDAETVNVTTDMCDYDFSEAGKVTVSVVYAGVTNTFEVTVTDVVLESIEIVNQPTKKEYDFGIDNVLNLEGIKVVAKYSNDTEREIAKESLTIEGFNSRAFGKQTITLKYGDKSATYEIEVKNISDDKYLGIDYASGAPSYESSQHNSLVVYFKLNGTYEELNSFWRTDKLDYVADYMLINGKKVSDLIKEGKVTRLCTWTNQLVIHLDTKYLVPATWVDKRDETHPDAVHYEEGVSEVVDTITFLPGFQWYTVTGILSGDLWGNDNAYMNATPISGAVLKEKITIKNEDGNFWTRPLITDDDGNVASDAVTLASLPTKTVYTVGDRLDVKGMKVIVKYADGGVEEIIPGVSEITGYKKDVEGKQTLSFTYMGQTVTFDVEVKKASSGKGCKSSVGVVGLAGLLAVLSSATFVLRKKRDEK